MKNASKRDATGAPARDVALLFHDLRRVLAFEGVRAFARENGNAMDVTCPRCQTDYEFDDALVSERGTTVKCTNCGHQFRVFRPRSSSPSAASPEIWRIERREGEPLELRSLVELQRAIRAGRVGRADLLRRGDGPPRRVGDIPELEPFFPTDANPPAGGTLPMTAQRTNTSPQINVSDRIPAHTPAYGKAPAQTPAPTQKISTLRPAAGVPPPNAPRLEGDRPRSVPPPPPNARANDSSIRTPMGMSPYQPMHEEQPPPPRSPFNVSARLNTPLPPVRTPPPPRPPIERGDRASLDDLAHGLPGVPQPPNDELEPPTQRRIDSGLSAPPEDETAQPSREELYESLFPHTRRRRPSGLGWIVGLTMVVGGAVLALTVGKPTIAKFFATEQPSASTTSGGRLQEAIAAGDRARTEGDYATARENYLRATVIDDKSMAAWDGYCTAETELAVVHWVAALATGSALEREQANQIGSAAGKTCARWAELARATDEGAKKVEADLRTAHALAAQGNVSATRLYVGSHAGDPIVEVLVLLADATGASSGPDGGRASDVKSAATTLSKTPPASLATPGDVAIAAYLAAATSDAARAQACLDELGKRAPRHMLLETLETLATTGDAGPLPASASVAPSASTAPTKIATGEKTSKPLGTGAPPVGGGTGESSGIPSGDWRDLDKRGHEALASGDVSKAETMFNAAMAQNPSDIDAMYGLGQIARSRGNHAGAMSYFQQVLDHSPGFSPARLALADEQWSTGNQGGAISNYKLYLESVPTGSGADRARSRIGQVEGTTTPNP